MLIVSVDITNVASTIDTLSLVETSAIHGFDCLSFFNSSASIHFTVVEKSVGGPAPNAPLSVLFVCLIVFWFG